MMLMLLPLQAAAVATASVWPCLSCILGMLLLPFPSSISSVLYRSRSTATRLCPCLLPTGDQIMLCCRHYQHTFKLRVGLPHLCKCFICVPAIWVQLRSCLVLHMLQSTGPMLCIWYAAWLRRITPGCPPPGFLPCLLHKLCNSCAIEAFRHIMCVTAMHTRSASELRGTCKICQVGLSHAGSGCSQLRHTH
jgi:hypothetical protein